MTAQTRSFDPIPAATERLERFVAGMLPGLGRAALTKTCLYTMAPDRDFVISPLPRHPAVVAAVADGHGFKFASLLGKALAEMAMQLPVSIDAARFRADRPTLAAEAGAGPARI